MTPRALILTAVLLAAPLAGCLETVGEGSFNGIEYRNPSEAPDFTLLDQNGQNVSLSDYDGKVVVLAFIYTSCPDVCLIISSNLQWAKMNLPEDMASDVAFLSVTIDPAKDTVDRLSRWTEATGYDWPHLTSNDIDELVGVWSDWNVVVDNDHINASTPPEDSSNRIVVLGVMAQRHPSTRRGARSSSDPMHEEWRKWPSRERTSLLTMKMGRSLNGLRTRASAGPLQFGTQSHGHGSARMPHWATSR